MIYRNFIIYFLLFFQSFIIFSEEVTGVWDLVLIRDEIEYSPIKFTFSYSDTSGTYRGISNDRGFEEEIIIELSKGDNTELTGVWRQTTEYPLYHITCNLSGIWNNNPDHASYIIQAKSVIQTDKLILRRPLTSIIVDSSPEQTLPEQEKSDPDVLVDGRLDSFTLDMVEMSGTPEGWVDLEGDWDVYLLGSDWNYPMGIHKISHGNKASTFISKNTDLSDMTKMEFKLSTLNDNVILDGIWVPIEKESYSYIPPKILKGVIENKNNPEWFKVQVETAAGWETQEQEPRELLFLKPVQSREWFPSAKSGDFTLYTTSDKEVGQMTVPAYFWKIMQDKSISSQDIEIPLGKALFSMIEADYDFVLFIYNLYQLPNDPVASRFININRFTEGLGLNPVDRRSELNAKDSILKGIIRLNERNALNQGPALHEFLHYWGAGYSEIFDQGVHWGASSINGQLGGFDPATLEAEGNGLYSASPFGFNANGGNSKPYSPLELYIMGLIPAVEVPGFIVGYNAEIINKNKDRTIFKLDYWKNWTIDQLIELYGERIPDYRNSQKVFSVFPVLVGPELDKGDNSDFFSTVHQFFLPHNNPGKKITGAYNFFEATNGRAELLLKPLELKEKK